MVNNGAQSFKLMNLQNYPQNALMNLKKSTPGTHTKTHNGGTVDGSYFQMHDVVNNDGSVMALAPTGKNLVEMDKL